MRITKKGKRILSLVLAILLVLSVIPPQITAMDNDDNDISVIGKTVKFTSTYPWLWTDPNNTNSQVQANASKLPAVMVIVGVHQFSTSTTLYQLDAAEGYTWPAGYPAENFTGKYWVESTKVAFVEICDKCGAVDCEKVHVFCPYCDIYDCVLEHNDPYQPYIAPVIAENPTLTPGADVSLVDEWGNPVTENFVVRAGQKYSLSAWPTLEGEVSYQWQACYNNAQMLWVDIYGQTGKGILANASMFRNLVDAQGITYLRCVTTNGSETMTSEPIAIFVDETVAQDSGAMFSTRSGHTVLSSVNGEANQIQPQNEVTYSITIKYVMMVAGVEAPSPWVVYLAPGEDYVLDVVPETVQGFYAGNAAGERIDRVTETITDIQQDREILVYYWPDYTKFKVQHYQQKVGDDSYELFAEETFEKKLKTGDMVKDGLAKNYAGFDALPYDTTITVAADGSTVVKIYYDRQYFMIALNLNGGYGAEPIYARYETPVSIPTPKCTGYTFAGWENTASGKIEPMVSTVPACRMEYKAQWTTADTKFTVAFWYENANDTEYTFVGSVQLDGKTNNTVSGSTYAALNKVDNAEHFDGFNADHAQHFTTLNAEKTDKNVTIAADGSTVVNVYFFRNGYELTYYEWKCNHEHSSECCSVAYHDHSSGCNYTKCGKTAHDHTGGRNSSCNAGSCSYGYEHTHSKSCVTNDLYEVTSNKDDLVSKYGTTLPNGTERTLDGGWLVGTMYFVIFDGVWYRCWVATQDFTWKCGGNKSKLTAHTHTTDCCNGQHAHVQSCCSINVHTHTSGCNTSNCKHLNPESCYKCGGAEDDMNNWEIAHQSYPKYGADVSAIHKQMENKTTGYRWVDMYFGGKATGENYGSGGAMGTLTSMPGGKTVFFRGGYNTSSTLFEMQYWLETYDGDVSGTRYYDGRWFKKHGEPFYTRMSYVAWNGDYVQGLPTGYEILDCTFGDSADNGGEEDPYGNSLKEARESRKKYNNYYYVREKFLLVYFNGSEKVAEETLMFEQPLTADHNIKLPSTAVSPYGAGYAFGGWYLDPECTVPVDWNNTRMPDGGNTGDIGLAVYAKWVPIQHEVKTYLTKEDIGKTPINTYSIFHGEVYEGTVAIPDNETLSFIGWFYEDDGKEIAYDFSMPVYRDMNLYGKWSSTVMTYGTIYYVDTNGKELADPIRVTGMVGDTKTYNAKFSSELGDGKTLYFPDATSHNIKFTANPDQNTHTFVYTALPEVKYTIKFVNKDNPSQELFTAVTGTAKTATVAYSAPTKDQWYVDKNSKEFALSSDESKNVFYFYYTYDPGKATVQVEHYIENLDGTGYDFHSETPATVEKLGTIIEAADRKVTINGFTYSHATFNNEAATQIELSGGLTIKLYYTRNSYSYTFKFMYTENGVQKEFPNSAVTGTAKYRANIVQAAKEFAGWKPDVGSKSIIIDYHDGVNVCTFVYTEEGVDLHYYVGAVQGGSVSSTGETVNAVTGTPSGSTATVKDGNYKFTGWYADYNCTQLVSSNIHFVPDKTDDGIYVAKTYYAGFEEVKVTINYEVQMPAGAQGQATLDKYSESVSVITGKLEGSKITNIPNGYEFAGWYLNNALVSNDPNYVPPRTSTPWVDGTTYVAVFVEKKATIRYEVMGPGNVSSAEEIVDMLTGNATGATASVVENYSKFLGWYDVYGNEISTDPNFKPTMLEGGWAESQIYYAKFEYVEYTITFVDRDQTVSTQTYHAGDLLSLPEVTNGNYRLTWTLKSTDGNWTAELLNEFLEGEPIMCYGNVTIVAEWTIDVYWVDWDGSFSTMSSATVLETDKNVPFGEEHIYNSQLPTKVDPEGLYTYTFKEWVVVDLSQYVQEGFEGIIVYRAVYSSSANSTSLTIRVDGCDTTLDPNQSFLLTVSDGNGVNLQVAVIENGHVTIDGLTIGQNYTITIDNDWSWRYESKQDQIVAAKDTDAAKNANSITITLEAGEDITFHMTRKYELWLDGCWASLFQRN